jgi:hypothetical protein
VRRDNTCDHVCEESLNADSIETITPVVAPSGKAYRNPELGELYLTGLRLAAGMPDE